MFDYLFEDITKKEIVLSAINGGVAGISWAFGSVIAIIFLELTLKRFLKNQFEKIAEVIKRIKK